MVVIGTELSEKEIVDDGMVIDYDDKGIENDRESYFDWEERNGEVGREIFWLE